MSGYVPVLMDLIESLPAMKSWLYLDEYIYIYLYKHNEDDIMNTYNNLSNDFGLAKRFEEKSKRATKE